MSDLISRDDALKTFQMEVCDGIFCHYCPILYESKTYECRLEKWIRGLPSANQWIPCSERLPSEDEVVLVWLQNGELEIDRVINGEWLINDIGVIAWQPLPQPYKGG